MKTLALILFLGATACATARQKPRLAEQLRLETSVASLTAEVAELRSQLDGAMAQNDSLGRSVTQLSLDVLDRELRIRSLQLELQRLKEIDLKPRRP